MKILVPWKKSMEIMEMWRIVGPILLRKGVLWLP